MLKTSSSGLQIVRRCLLRPVPHQGRGLATRRTVNLPAPSAMMAQLATVDLQHISSGSTPACGWRKSIVSSATCMSLEEELESTEAESSQSVEDLTSKELTLNVDMEELRNLASMRCTPLSLKDMYKYAVDFSNAEQRLRNAQFLHKELPIRIAQRAIDLLTLPNGLSDVAPIRQIAHLYLLYLEKFQELPVPTTPEEEDAFTEMINGMVLDRSSVPISLARGVDEWLRMYNESKSSGEVVKDDGMLQQMEDALYRFFTARTGLRFLTEHHVLSSPTRREKFITLRRTQSSFLNEDDVDMGFLGCIQTDCNPGNEVRKVAANIKRQTEECYGLCPDIQIVDAAQKRDTKFTYVPHHLHYMVGELIKNSCRATVVK